MKSNRRNREGGDTRKRLLWLVTPCGVVLLGMCIWVTGCAEDTSRPSESLGPQSPQVNSSEPQPPTPPGRLVRRRRKPSPDQLHLVFEAEAAKAVKAPMVVKEAVGAAKGKGIYIPLQPKKSPQKGGELTLSIEIPRDIEARFWYRVMWKGACANSLTMSVSGSQVYAVTDGTYNKWHWVKGPQIPLKKGTLPLQLKQREDNLWIDQVVVTSDLGYVPVGIEEQP